MDVSWSAHNGNGLSEGFAHSQSQFAIPEPPPVPKRTSQQTADLGHASNAMWKAGAIIAVGGLVITVLSGGTLAPFALGLLGGGVAAYMAADISDVAIDPPDPNYMITVVPQNLSLPTFVAGDGISAAAAAALNALRAVQTDETGQAGAMVAALYKAEGAGAANDLVWERTQTLAAAAFAHQLAVDLNSEPPLRSAARSALEAGGFPVFTVTQQQAADQQSAWDSLGLPSALMDALTLGGVRPGVDDRLHALARSYSASQFIQQNVLDLLAPASPQAGPNLLEAANTEAAVALLAWSDALRLNPAGPLSGSPPQPPTPIITSVQPNQGAAAGGTTVSISGSNLLNTTQVNFGARPASSGSCSDFQCTVVSPSGTGTVDVTAIGPGGTSAVTEADRFTYLTGSASEIKAGVWYHFQFVGVGSIATGSNPGTGYLNPGMIPWTLTAPIEGIDFRVTDGNTAGDAFDVLDFGQLVGTTSAVSADPNHYCGDTPDGCFSDPAMSHGLFFLPAGPHQITIRAAASVKVIQSLNL